LFFLGSYPILFSVLYFYCGLSDIVDGYIARRWKAESAIGAKLDSLGDFIFYILVTVMFFTQTEVMKESSVLWLVVSVFIIKLLNAVITKIKFRQWNIMHTLGNKLSGLLIYFMLPLYILLPHTPIIVGIIIVSIALLATVEETFILFISKQYNPNQKSIYNK